MPVNQHSGEKQERTTKTGNASSAERRSELIAITSSHIAVENVERSGVADVFNITVEDAHEYFANGILVSNCDANRYAKINCLKLIKSEKQALSTKPTFGKRRNPNPDKWRR